MNATKDTLYKKLFLLIAIIVITSFHYLTTINIHILHDIYQRLYYIPIIFACVWFGVKGGLGTSGIISVIYFSHIIFQWRVSPKVNLQKYLEIMMFNIVALITSVLIEREQKLKNKYYDTAGKLKESYEKLKQQAKDMIEIEEQLRRADKLTMLGQISAELAHEIRNPLGSIKGTVEIIKKDYTPDNKKYEFIEILIKETNRLSQVLNNFLSFAKEKVLIPSSVDVNLLIKDITKILEIQLKKMGIGVNFNLDETLPKIKFESQQLKQVFFNIMLNAMQAMPSGGDLNITTRINGEYKHLCVDFTDTGTGIASDMLKDIFKPFYTSKEEGTGLGLSISQKIIEKFGGEIIVESELGKGSTFTVRLPYAKKE